MQRLPVIVGVGEITDRPSDPAHSLEPIALMAEALRHAALDANFDLDEIDSLDIVHQVSWRYEKTAARLCERLGINPARAVYGVTGGESPVRYLHEAALRIARGDSNVAAIVGGEAQYAVNKAKAAAIDLPWTPLAKDVENPFPTAGRLNDQAIAHGSIRPIHVYPFYENASHLLWRQSPREALEESAALYARFSKVASGNPYAWSRQVFTAEDISAASQGNRPICHPYTKRTVANPAVNQGAAVLLTSVATARKLKIDPSKWIYVWGGSQANEPRDYLERDQYGRSDAQEIVLAGLAKLVDDNRGKLDAFELYSCFPCVPKMTRRLLRLPVDATPTVTGGLSFFGAPLNNYMTHATCAMVRHLRHDEGATGLLYGQGEFVTKHHGMIVSREAPQAAPHANYSLQSELDRRRGAVPILATEYRGEAQIETFTVTHDRDGSPTHGTVIARTPDARILCRVAGADNKSIAALLDPAKSPIGTTGSIQMRDGLAFMEL